MSARAIAVAVTLVLFPVDAGALTQPSGAAIPSPMGCSGGNPTGLAATFACVCDTPGICNIGAPCPAPGMCDDGVHAACETTLYHSFNDNTCIPSHLAGLDPYSEAAIMPETFSPSCPLTFRLITRGTAIFHDVFGWYNVTGARPAASDLHPMLGCDAVPGASAILDIGSDPAYLGGEIGFFIATPESHASAGTCAGGDCCASVARTVMGQGWLYFSQRAWNDDDTGPSAFIHMVDFDSHLHAEKFFFAWEDIFGGSNDDFTDLVTSVEGIECAGGGQACDTGQLGACAYGVSRCEDGALGCVQLYGAGAETCNGADDDGDGAIDDGATCADPNDICHDGRCVPHCALTSEFVCPPSSACDAASGLCVDPACVGVACPAG